MYDLISLLPYCLFLLYCFFFPSPFSSSPLPLFHPSILPSSLIPLLPCPSTYRFVLESSISRGCETIENLRRIVFTSILDFVYFFFLFAFGVVHLNITIIHHHHDPLHSCGDEVDSVTKQLGSFILHLIFKFLEHPFHSSCSTWYRSIFIEFIRLV